jgi:argininosuccinate lyase
MVTTFGHLLLSFAEAFQRDVRRFMHWFPLFNRNPLGGAAGYGTSFPLDRELTSRLLAFDGPTLNVTDPITQRWEPEAEVAYGIAVMMDHLSSLSQTLILLSTSEFNLVRLHDRHCSGSSIMPQKKNPDTLEVVKAKTSFAHGMVTSFLSMGKALFIGYNRDTQWTKYWIMDLIEETQPALPVMTDVVRLLEVHEVRMEKEAQSGFVGATALMEWMVFSFRLPLRKAKVLVERAVKYSEAEGLREISFSSLKRALEEMKLRVPLTEIPVQEAQQARHVLSRPLSVGTPAEKRVREHQKVLRDQIRQARAWCVGQRQKIKKAKEQISRMEKALGI